MERIAIMNEVIPLMILLTALTCVLVIVVGYLTRPRVNKAQDARDREYIMLRLELYALSNQRHSSNRTQQRAMEIFVRMSELEDKGVTVR